MFAIAFGRTGAVLDVVHVVDDTPVVAQSSSDADPFDPTTVIDVLDRQGLGLLEAARRRFRAAGVELSTTLIHGRPIPAIVGAADNHSDQLIIMGTQARTGLPRTFLGSTTEGVIRSGTIPVLAVRSTMSLREPPFGRLLVAVDDSDPATAAVELAARFSRDLGSTCVLCSVVDARELVEKAAVYGCDTVPLVAELRAHAEETVGRARARGGFRAGAASVAVVEADSADGIITETVKSGADAIVMGSHGRRGLQSLFLGSVAEEVIRRSPVPVFMVRSAGWNSLANAETSAASPESGSSRIPTV